MHTWLQEGGPISEARTELDEGAENATQMGEEFRAGPGDFSQLQEKRRLPGNVTEIRLTK